MKRLGEKLRTLRQNRAVTQQQIADMLGVGRVFISNLERGENIPNLATLIKIADIFGVTLDQLARDDQEVDEEPPYLFGPGYKRDE